MRRNDTSLSGLAGSVVPTTAKVTPSEIDVLFMCAAQRRDFFLDISREITSNLFTLEGELHYEILWLTLEQIYSQTDAISPVSFGAIINRFLDTRAGSDGPFFRHLLLGPGGYHQMLFAVPVTNHDVDICRNIVVRFLIERRVESPLRRMLSSAGPNSPANLQSILETANKDVAQITSSQNLPVLSVADPFGTDLPPPLDYDSTGIPWMDRRLDGQRRMTVNCMLGPTGGGKTTFAIHKSVASARQAYVEALIKRQQTGQHVKPEFVVLVTAEESAEMIKPRLQSAAFSIPRNTLELMTDWRQLSTADTGPRQYERDLTEVQRYGPLANVYTGGIPQIDVLSERERYQLHQEWFNECCVLVDISGSAEFPNAGSGFIDEIAAIIERLVEMRQQTVREVVIDWAGAVCERFIRANNLRPEHMRHLLNIFGDECKRKIANKQNCTVWITHQLKGALGRAMPGKLMHHTDAAECATFAVHMTTAGCLGTEDKRTGVRMLNFSKTRLNKGTIAARPLSLQIHPLFCEMVDVTDTYTTDNQNQIVSTDEAQRISGFELPVVDEGGDE